MSEAVATFGLIWTATRVSPTAVPSLVAAYIGAAYWFTASTSFVNPAVTIARAFTDSFSGIRPEDVSGFVLAQAVGSVMAVAFFAWPLPVGSAVSLARSDSRQRAGFTAESGT